MCGIVGSAGDLGRFSKLMFKTMLELDIVRGEDSTGVMIHNDSGSHIFKEVGVPWLGLYKDPDFTQMMGDISNNIYLGHNRAATIGAVTKANAHPFKCGHIYGAHNGSLYNRIDLEDSGYFEVDSENLFHHMSVHGVVETINKLQGAFALVWYNEEEDTINFIRNVQRPLFFAFSSDGMTLFWASEMWMLDRSAKKAKLRLGDIHAFRELCHYKMKLPPTGGLWMNRKFGKMRVKKLESWTYVAPPVTAYSHTGQSNYGRHISNQYPAVIGNNVFPIGGRAVASTSPKVYRGDTIIFIIDAPIHLHNRAESSYIRGHVLHSDREIRLNPKFGSEAWMKYANIGQVYSGKVKKTKGGYAIITLGTIKESSKDIISAAPFEADEHTVLAYRVDDEFVTLTKFEELIAKGCCVCGSPLFKEDEPVLDWYGEEPVCSGCHIEDVIDGMS